MNALYWPGMSAQYEGATDTIISELSNSDIIFVISSFITHLAVPSANPKVEEVQSLLSDIKETVDGFIAVGGGKKDEPMELCVGDTVLYGKYAGTEISVDGKDYLIMRQSDVVAVLK